MSATSKLFKSYGNSVLLLLAAGSFLFGLGLSAERSIFMGLATMAFVMGSMFVGMALAFMQVRDKQREADDERLRLFDEEMQEYKRAIASIVKKERKLARQTMLEISRAVGVTVGLKVMDICKGGLPTDEYQHAAMDDIEKMVEAEVAELDSRLSREEPE